MYILFIQIVKLPDDADTLGRPHIKDAYIKNKNNILPIYKYK